MPISNDSIEQQPNLVFVITDDQGYGDFSCHANPIIETPNLGCYAQRKPSFDQSTRGSHLCTHTSGHYDGTLL